MFSEDSVTSFVDRFGEFGIGILMFLETLLPPIPSELVLPFAGAQSRAGNLVVVLAWMAATTGSVLGALVLYELGRRIGYERLDHLASKRWFFILSQKELRRGSRAFDRHGSWVVLGGRCLPFIRSVVSIPAGVNHMRLPRFLALTALGTAAWSALLIYGGWILQSRWHNVSDLLEPLSIAVTVGIAGLLILVLFRRLRIS